MLMEEINELVNVGELKKESNKRKEKKLDDITLCYCSKIDIFSSLPTIRRFIL